MIYKTENKIVIEIDYGCEEYLVDAIKGLLFCLRHLDEKCLSYEDLQMSLWLLEELIPSWQQIDLSKKP